MVKIENFEVSQVDFTCGNGRPHFPTLFPYKWQSKAKYSILVGLYLIENIVCQEIVTCLKGGCAGRCSVRVCSLRDKCNNCNK